MELELEAVYENGTLKLDRELPLANGQRVKLILQQPPGRRWERGEPFHWQGSQEDLHYLILSDDNDVLEAQ